MPECLIVEAALIFGKAEKALSLWSMGVNQSTVGVYKNNAIHNLHLATGKIGKPGSGPFSLTGQPNAMGAGKWEDFHTCYPVIGASKMSNTVKKSPAFGDCPMTRFRLIPDCPRWNNLKH